MADVRGALPSDNFTIMPNDWGSDPSLTLEAKGLLLVISSYQQEHPLSLQQLLAQSSDGHDVVRAGLRELLDAGYIDARYEQVLEAVATAVIPPPTPGEDA